MGAQLVPLETLYKATDTDYNEFLTVDDTFLDTYFESLYQADSEASAPGQNKGAKAPKAQRRRVRSTRHKVLNRLAQLRYRERKKEKQATFQDHVKSLSGRVSPCGSTGHTAPA